MLSREKEKWKRKCEGGTATEWRKKGPEWGSG